MSAFAFNIPFTEDIFLPEAREPEADFFTGAAADLPEVEEDDNATYYNPFDYLGGPSVKIAEEPQSLLEVVADAFAGKKAFLDKADFARETGLGSEINRFNPFFTKAGGLSVFAWAENIAYSCSYTGLIPLDECGGWDIQAVREAIIELFQTCGKPSDIHNYTKNANIQRARQIENMYLSNFSS